MWSIAIRLTIFEMSLDQAMSKIRLSELVTSSNLMIYFLPVDLCTPLAHCSCHCQTQVCCLVHCVLEQILCIRNSVISVFRTQRCRCCCTLRCHVSLLLDQSSTSPMFRFVVTQPKNPGGMSVKVDMWKFMCRKTKPISGVVTGSLSVKVGNLFESYRSTIINIYNGAYDTSAVVFLIIKVMGTWCNKTF